MEETIKMEETIRPKMISATQRRIPFTVSLDRGIIMQINNHLNNNKITNKSTFIEGIIKEYLDKQLH